MKKIADKMVVILIRIKCELEKNWWNLELLGDLDGEYHIKKLELIITNYFLNDDRN